MRHIVIGDVHGCFTELKELLLELRVTEEDALIFLGDLIDRGPDSEATVSLVRLLAENGYNVTLVEANHEENHLNNLSINRFNEVELSIENLDFICNTKLYHKFNSGNKDFVCVHGGFTPEFFDMYGGLPDLEEVMQNPLMLERAHRFIRTRRITGRGRMAHISRLDCPLWGDLYQGEAGTVFYGHEPFDEVKTHAHAYGIDTGCAYGGELTAAVVENGEISFVSVPSTFDVELLLPDYVWYNYYPTTVKS